MNLLFRTLVAIYSFISAIICGIIMCSPFADKLLMSAVLDYLNITFYQSNRYDIGIFIIGLVFFSLNITVLISGIKGKRSHKYYCTETESGVVRISSNSVENVALALSKRFTGVKDAKTKVKFRRDTVDVFVRLTVLPDVHVPNLCKNIQERVKESIEASMDLLVGTVDVSVESVHTPQKPEE